MTDFERIRTILERAVAKLCPRWMSDRQEDLVQQALLRLLDRASKGESKEAPNPSYLWKVAHSVTVDEIREMKSKGAMPLDSDRAATAPQEGGPRSEPDPAPWELGDAIRECLAELSPRRRRVVTLHLLGHSLAETAERLAWRYDQVRNLLYRGMHQLRLCLAAKGFKP